MPVGGSVLIVLSLAFTGLFACTDPDDDEDGFPLSEDCDDANPNVYPGAPEACDGLDNSCDGQVDEDILGSTIWHADADGDGFGGDEPTLVACRDPGDGWVDDASDCDDGDAEVSPVGVERCSGEDDDCNGWVDDDASDSVTYWEDDDGDGFGDSERPIQACVELPGFVAIDGDCDDRDPAVNPGATEVCDTVDNDCDGAVDVAGGTSLCP